MRAPQTAIGAGTLALGALIAFGATRISADAGYSGVGPNFLPLLVGALLTVCGGFLVWEAGSGGFRAMEAPSGAARGDWPAVLWVSAGFLLNAALITRIGFVLSCVLCFVLAVRGFKASEGQRDLSPRAWVTDVLIGFAIAAPVYWMFGKLLAISLPGISSSGWI